MIDAADVALLTSLEISELGKLGLRARAAARRSFARGAVLAQVVELVEPLLVRGVSEKAIAAAIGVDARTLKRWRSLSVKKPMGKVASVPIPAPLRVLQNDLFETHMVGRSPGESFVFIPSSRALPKLDEPRATQEHADGALRDGLSRAPGLLVLFVTGNFDPRIGDTRALAHEGWIVSQSLRLSPIFDCRPLLNATIADVHAALREHQPTVLHIAAHATDHGLYLSDEHGHAECVSGDVWGRAIASTKHVPDIVFLNYCRSSGAAAALLAGGVKYVISWSTEFGGEEASAVSELFYPALGAGVSIGICFDEAKFLIDNRFPHRKGSLTLSS